MTRKSKVFVLGSLNVDLVISASRMPEQGETIVGSDFLSNAGGKGANQAVAAAKIGCDVEMIGAVGDDYSRNTALDSLTRVGVGISNVSLKEGVTTGKAVIVRTFGDNRIILDAGANALVNESDLEKGLTGSNGDIFISQFEIPVEIVYKGLKKAKEQGMTTILNPAPVANISDNMYPLIDYLVINQTESQLLTNIYPKNVKDCEDMYKYFSKKGVKNLVVTLGEIGSVLINENTYYQEAYKITPVDTTGAGDSYIGALAYAITQNMDDHAKLKFSNATSALTCLSVGAQQSMPNYDDVQTFIKGEIE